MSWWKKKIKKQPLETADIKQAKEAQAAQENEALVLTLFKDASKVEPLGEYNHRRAVAGFYYHMCRVHGFFLASEMAVTFYDTQKHIIKKTEQYANRLRKADDM